MTRKNRKGLINNKNEALLLRRSLELDILLDEYTDKLRTTVGVHVYRHLDIILTSVNITEIKKSIAAIEDRLNYFKEVLELDSRPVIELQAIYNQALKRFEILEGE